MICTLGAACSSSRSDASRSTAGAPSAGVGGATGGSERSSGGAAGANQPTAGKPDGAGDGGQPNDFAGAGGTLEPMPGLEAGAGGESGGDGSACETTSRVIARADKAWALALDSAYAYWTTRDLHGTVMRAPIAGGAAETIAANEIHPHALAVMGGQVFWAALGKEPDHLFQASVTGEGRQELATGTFSGISSLNADQAYVYYVSERKAVRRVPIGGGPVEDIGAGAFNTTLSDMVLDGSTLYLADSGVGLFVPTEAETASVLSLDVSGVSDMVPLVSRLDFPQFEIATDKEHVYWSDESAIYRTVKIGGPYTTVTALPPAAPDVSPIVDLASDGANLFYSDGQSVYRVPTAGGTAPEVITKGWSRIVKLALDEDSVYFTDYVTGAVVKVAKCASALQPSDLGIAPTSGEPNTPDPSGQAGGAGVPATDPSCDPASSLHGCPEVSVVATATQSYGLAVDHDYVYFSTFQANGSVMRVPVGGGDAEAFISGESYPHDIALDDSRVFWCLGNTAPGYLASKLKLGGDRVAMATGNANGLGRVTSDGTFAYYITAFNAVYRVAVGGGTPAVIAAGPYNSNVNDIAYYDGEIFWTNDGLWKSDYSAKIPGTGYLGRTAVSGRADLGHAAVKATLSSPLDRLAADASYVYFIDKDSIYRANRSGGEASVLAPLAPASGTIADLLSDGEHLYFADKHAVYRLPVTGGTVEQLSYGWTSLRSIAVDDSSLYFTDQGGGLVLKRPK